MIFKEQQVLYLFAVICIVLMVLSLMLIFLSLPGNWVILILAGLWSFFTQAAGFGWSFFALLIGLAALGELVEFLAGYFGSKRYGGTNKGSVGGMIGAVAGAILCAPFFFGLGALPGALAGSFTGTFLMEKSHGMESQAAINAAFGSTLGRFGGFVVKLGIGISMVWMCATRIWAGL